MANEYGELIRLEFEREQLGARDLRQRAIGIVSLSSSLVALLAGLMTIGARSNTGIVPSSARLPLVVALLAFVSASIAALLVNWPRLGVGSDPKDLQSLIDDDWNDDQAEQSVAALRVDMLTSLRSNNKIGAQWLLTAIALEVIAIASTGVMAYVVVNAFL